jgi:hypothetical protein
MLLLFCIVRPIIRHHCLYTIVGIVPIAPLIAAWSAANGRPDGNGGSAVIAMQ